MPWEGSLAASAPSLHRPRGLCDREKAGFLLFPSHSPSAPGMVQMLCNQLTSVTESGNCDCKPCRL